MEGRHLNQCYMYDFTVGYPRGYQRDEIISQGSSQIQQIYFFPQAQPLHSSSNYVTWSQGPEVLGQPFIKALCLRLLPSFIVAGSLAFSDTCVPCRLQTGLIHEGRFFFLSPP